MAEYAQGDRLLSITTPLGPDAVLLVSMQGKEELSQLFEFELDLLSERTDIGPKDLVGQPVSFTVRSFDGESRVFQGHVCRLAACDLQGTDLRRYRATVVPWLWFLCRTSDCRIFQEMTVLEIVEKIFGDLGFDAYEIKCAGSYSTQEYVVQYRESDLDFVSRLLEHSGIFFYFRHDDDREVMVLGDQALHYYDAKDSEVPFNSGSLEPRHVSFWEHRYEFVTGKWAYTDYDFKAPRNDLHADIEIASEVASALPKAASFEVYDYPGGYLVKSTGDDLVEARIQEQEKDFEFIVAESSCFSFSPGAKFSLSIHDFDSEVGVPFVVTAIEHYAAESSYTTGAPLDRVYRNTFRCISAERTFRPARVTPRARVEGPQTAVVVGPSGEEVYTDEYGRVKVQFHWDREGKQDENSSCWIRVSQDWAGKKWGGVFLPRIGQEVIVSFLEGDPDRPIITGRVYNADLMPPYDLPANKTQSGIKTRSSKGGDPTTFNEIRFEDKKGSEELYVHAEKDKTVVVENDRNETVGHDETYSIGNDQTVSIGHDRKEDVGNDETISIVNNRTETVGVNETITIGADRTESVGSNETVTVTLVRTHVVGVNDSVSVGAAQEITVGAARALTVGLSQTTSIGVSEDHSVGDSRSIDVGKDQSLSVGKNLAETVGDSYTHKTKKKILIDAGDEITIKTGSAKIVMKKSGDITIEGKKINIKASGDIVMKGSKILQN